MSKTQANILIGLAFVAVLIFGIAALTGGDDEPGATVTTTTVPMTAEEYAALTPEEKVAEIDASIARIESAIGTEPAEASGSLQDQWREEVANRGIPVEWSSQSDATIDKFLESYCGMADIIPDQPDLWVELIEAGGRDAGMSENFVHAYASASIIVYCPQHSGMLEGLR